MARLNIEDEFFITVMGMSAPGVDVDKIMGNALRFFRHSQEKFRLGRVVTELEYQKLGFMPELVGIFAEQVEGGYQAMGANKFFSWLLDSTEKGRIGGQVSAQRPRDSKGRLLSKQDPSKVQADSKQVQAVQPSLSTSLKKKKEKIEKNGSVETVDKSRAFLPTTPTELWDGMLPARRAAWKEIYPDDQFLQQTTARAFQYYKFDQPTDLPRTVRGWSKALSHWFETGWKRHRAEIRQPRTQTKGSFNQPYAPVLNFPKPVEVSEGGRSLARLLADIMRSEGRSGVSTALRLSPKEYADQIELSWGTWAAKPIEQAEREILIEVATLEKRFQGVTA